MSSLGTIFDASGREIRPSWPEEHGNWEMNDLDMTLYALLCDPIYCSELLLEDAKNREYGGTYVVRAHQYVLFRGQGSHYEAFPCARAVGKTEGQKAWALCQPFRRMPGEDMLITAPELIHLLPLTDAIEDRILATRLTREFLDTSNQGTGFQHRPFQCSWADSLKIYGRIPRVDGRGVKAMHVADLVVEEAQDYPEPGWVEVHETLEKSIEDFTYRVYGVHSGARSTGFERRSKGGGFKVHTVTAMQRETWNVEEKNAAKSAYGGTASPDYRRNILGEAGGASSPIFNLARLVACMDQNRDSDYNLHGYKHQEIRSEEFDELALPIADVLDLPSGLKRVWAGADLGLTSAPTVITIWSEEKVSGVMRLKLVRRIHLERMRTKQIRYAIYAIFTHFGSAFQGFGMDETGLGFPIFQEIEDDESKPDGIMEKFSGWFFNSKVPVGIERTSLTQDDRGNFKDQYGSAVEERINPLTNEKEYVIYMPMIEASTRYLREFVDSTFMMLPFDPEVISDMTGETAQRLRRIAGLKSKPNAFHILDSERAMSMAYKREHVAELVAEVPQRPVLEEAL